MFCVSEALIYLHFLPQLTSHRCTERGSSGTHSQELLLAVLDHLLFPAGEKIEADRQETLQAGHHQGRPQLLVLVQFLAASTLLLLLQGQCEELSAVHVSYSTFFFFIQLTCNLE